MSSPRSEPEPALLKNEMISMLEVSVVFGLDACGLREWYGRLC